MPHNRNPLGIEKMNVAKEKALVIEDTMPGALGAVNANIDVIVYCDHYERNQFTN